MNIKNGLCFLSCLLFSMVFPWTSGLSATETFSIQTDSLKPIAEFDRFFSQEGSRIYLSVDFPRKWLPFSHDGRTVLPYSGIWLHDVSFMKPAGEDPSGTLGGSLKMIMKKGRWENGGDVYQCSNPVMSWVGPGSGHWAALVLDAENKKLFHLFLAGKKIYSVETHWQEGTLPVYDLTFSPDGEHLAFAVLKRKSALGKERALLVLDGKEVGMPDGREYVSGSVAFSPKGGHLVYFAASSSAFKAEAFMIYDGESVDSRKYKRPPVFSQRPHFSPDGRYIVYPALVASGLLGSSHRYDRIFDIAEKQVLTDGAIIDCGFNHDSSNFFFVERTANKLYKITTASSSGIYSKLGEIKFSPDGLRLAYAALSGGKWQLWNNGATKDLPGEPEHLTFSPDGKRLACTARTPDKKWKVIVDGQEWGPYDKFQENLDYFHDTLYPERPLFFSPDGTRVAYAAAVGKTFSLYVDGEARYSYDRIGIPVFSPDGSRIATWASEAGKEFVVLDGIKFAEFETVDPWHLIFSPDGKHIAYKAGDKRQWFGVVVDATRSNHGFDQIITAHPSRCGIVFSSPEQFYYMGLSKKTLVLVDERIRGH